METQQLYNAECQRCPRLAAHLKKISKQYPSYFCRPVPGFGELQSHLLIVGLAPGLHGANASGRVFTGDHAGILLYQILYKHGFASAELSQSAADGLQLHNCRIVNAVKCLPPANKPIGSEINNCNDYLQAEFRLLPAGAVILALGGVAHNAILRALQLKRSEYRFAHAATHVLSDQLILLDSYHCSRYNTQTKRLTETMFNDVFVKAKALL